MRRWPLHIFACLVALLAWRGAAAQSIDPVQLQRDLDALTAHPSRVIGSPGYDAAAAYIEQQLTALGSR